MQIYETRQEAQASENNYITELIENDFDLLVSSYQRLKLDPSGFKELISEIVSKFDLEVRFPRKGDVNERFDVLLSSDNHQIVSEIEIPSVAILDAPRNLLDDIAVQINRHGMEADKLIPLVICWDLPNNRTDYWNVVVDVDNILNIRIKTCTVLGLAILAWTANTFDPGSDDYYLNSSSNSLDNILKILSENSIDPEEYRGLLFPLK